MCTRRSLVSLFLGLLAAAAGCRKPLAPTFDRNQPPETWITAAPLDTITTRDGTSPVEGTPGRIPSRYHLYWAGSDADGRVAGFFFAVVETLALPIPPSNEPPPLPGPKPGDYRFTSKTDSVFTFSVTDERKNRRHAFYLYAVDDRGKPDPTPARFVFDAYDRFPPLPVIDRFLATGFVWRQDPVTLALFRALEVDTVRSTDTIALGAVPKRTVPSGSRLDIAWHSEITGVGNEAVGYRYRLDEPDWVDVGASVTTVSYNTGPGDAVGPGRKQFRLRAVDHAGGANETTRLFQMNLTPTTWFAGANPAAPVWQHAGGETFVNVIQWSPLAPDLRGISLLSSDSLNVLPSQRPPRRNFLEIYGNRIYLRREFETVHMNSWVVFHNGGFDPDSPYNLVVSTSESQLPQIPDPTDSLRTLADTASYVVLQARPANGSPVGFRSQAPMLLTPFGSPTHPTLSSLYPNFDPNSTFRAWDIGAYYPMNQAGQVYAWARAQDGDGAQDLHVGSSPALDPIAIVRAVDSTGSASPEQVAARPLVFTFFVDQPPQLVTTGAAFAPKPGGAVYPRDDLPLVMVSADGDPYDEANPPTSVGGGSVVPVFRYTIRFRAPRNGGAPGDSVTFAPGTLDRIFGGSVPPSVAIPDSLGGTSLRVMIQLCDCRTCETTPGAGRCVDVSYLINVSPPASVVGEEAGATGSHRPGSGWRREDP